MLSAVITEGTGRSAGKLRGPLAGKTGTTNDYHDALFVGYSPRVVSGVWVGNDSATPLGPRETGARAALPIWIEFMHHVLENQPQAYFDIPEDIRRIYIHARTGEQVPAGSSQAVRAMIQ